jgi:uncharacterized protein YndB with AHSA1/START domain
VEEPLTGPPTASAFVRWRLHLASPPAAVFEAIATSDGRARFWAESARRVGDQIEFVFPDGARHRGRVLKEAAPSRFVVEYYGGTTATFVLDDDGAGGTDLTVTDEGVNAEWFAETNAGWVSVLLALKAAVDHGVDLRNHHPDRTWDLGFADN